MPSLTIALRAVEWVDLAVTLIVGTLLTEGAIAMYLYTRLTALMNAPRGTSGWQ